MKNIYFIILFLLFGDILLLATDDLDKPVFKKHGHYLEIKCSPTFIYNKDSGLNDFFQALNIPNFNKKKLSKMISIEGSYIPSLLVGGLGLYANYYLNSFAIKKHESTQTLKLSNSYSFGITFKFICLFTKYIKIDLGIKAGLGFHNLSIFDNNKLLNEYKAMGMDGCFFLRADYIIPYFYSYYKENEFESYSYFVLGIEFSRRVCDAKWDKATVFNEISLPKALIEGFALSISIGYNYQYFKRSNSVPFPVID